MDLRWERLRVVFGLGGAGGVFSGRGRKGETVLEVWELAGIGIWATFLIDDIRPLGFSFSFSFFFSFSSSQYPLCLLKKAPKVVCRYRPLLETPCM